MNQRKHRTRLLGLLVVAALGVMAFAASAQAVVPGFLVGGVKDPALTNIIAKSEGVGTMLVPGLNFQLSCTTMTTDAPTEITSKTFAEAHLLFTGCTTLSITKPLEEIHCHVKEPILANPILLPAELKKPLPLDGPAILAERIKALVVLHLPSPPAPKLGEVPCVLPLDNTVTGEVCFQIIGNDTKEPLLFANPSEPKGTAATVECLERITLEGLNNEGPGFKDKLKYGAQEVTLDGAALISAASGATLGVSLY